jgi:NDP-sugar pyrophosphorylase family protein
MILHQIEALAAAGVTDIVLAVNYRPEVMEKYLAEVRLSPVLKYLLLLLLPIRSQLTGGFPYSTKSNTTSRSHSRSRQSP